jgi:phosphatidylinositol 4-kinase A
MFDIPTFLMRWLFLSNIIRDVAEIQTLPQQPYYPPPPSPRHSPSQHNEHEVEAHWKDECLRGILSYPPGTQRLLVMDALRVELTNQLGQELHAAQDCIRRLAAAKKQQRQKRQQRHHHHGRADDILNHPQNNHQRHLSDVYNDSENDNDTRNRDDDDDPYLDADVEIVKAAIEKMKNGILPTPSSSSKTKKERVFSSTGSTTVDALMEISNRGASLIPNIDSAADGLSSSSSSLSSSAMSVEEDSTDDEDVIHTPAKTNTKDEHEHVETTTSHSHNRIQPPTEEEMARARKTLRQSRDLLPQLVSAVLKSPHNAADTISHHQQHHDSTSTTTVSNNPIQRFRQIILSRCLEDPSWGIELCWLLEAEVGRAWKTLFEHRQQTGRRLIVVLPAEKAAVLAKIGMEKREAFDLLQDAEQATAYGYTNDQHYYNDNAHDTAATRAMVEYGSGSSPSIPPPPPPPPPRGRLPSSLSLRRCSHFGDAMHFIDRLTQISLDLRFIPTQERTAHLHERLEEMNRRIRRRMVTKGDVSLDVQDGRGPHDWPQIHDLRLDMLKYSVHFPLVSQVGVWPTVPPPSDHTDNAAGSTTTSEVNNDDEEAGKPLIPEVVRVLNIVTPESRLLSSRERCPFLVQMEVADTGLGGNDARLYAAGAQGLGSTVEEALGMNPLASATASSAAAAMHNKAQSATAAAGGTYEIPPELMEEPLSSFDEQTGMRSPLDQTVESESGLESVASTPQVPSQNFDNGSFARGGWQSDQSYFHEEDAGYMYPDPDGYVQQQQYERLHEVMQQPAAHAPNAFAHPAASYGQFQQQQLPIVSLGVDLLNQVYGEPLIQKCQEIRKTSPFGHVKGWRLASFIMKAGEDIRREALVMQVISSLSTWFEREIPLEHRPFMRPYTIMCVGGDAGLVECLSDAKSVDEVKKKTDTFLSLRDYFERAYGPPTRRRQEQQQYSMDGHSRAPPPPALPSSSTRPSETFERAQDNFLRSLVGYSLVCYVLQIKDRHNANILLDREGHIIHIDFGFVLGDTPKMSKVPLFTERAPFKLSEEFWQVLGGWNVKHGGLGVKFCNMFEWAFMCAAAHVEEIATMVETTLLSLDDNPRVARMAASGVRSRLRMRGPPGSVQQKMFIIDLVNAALANWGQTTYDLLQRAINGYQ